MVVRDMGWEVDKMAEGSQKVPNSSYNLIMISSVHFSLSHVCLFATPWTAVHQSSPSITNSWSLLKLMSIESMMPSNHLILCHPLLLLPPIFPSIRDFSSESVLHIRWQKYWSFRFSISPSNDNSGLISFRMDWFVLLAVQGTLKSLLYHHNQIWYGDVMYNMVAVVNNTVLHIWKFLRE